MERMEGTVVVDEDDGRTVELILEQQLEKFLRRWMDEVEDLAPYHVKQYSEAVLLPDHGSRGSIVYIWHNVRELQVVFCIYNRLWFILKLQHIIYISKDI
jgi:hypothetical protein